MSQEITLAKAAESAEQAEIVCRLLESHPHRLEDGEVAVIASLLSRLTGDVVSWMIEERAQREGGK